MSSLTAQGHGALDVVRRAHLTYRRLDYLVVGGFVRPPTRRIVGSGSPRTFRPVDVAVTAVLGRLGESGYDRRTWAPVADTLYVLGWPWPRCWLQVWGKGHHHRILEVPELVNDGEVVVASIVIRLPPDVAP